MLPLPVRLLVVLALQSALAVVPALDGPARDRPLDRTSVVAADAASVETGVLSPPNVAEQEGVILESAHDRVADRSVAELGLRTGATASRLLLVGRVGLRSSLALAADAYQTGGVWTFRSQVNLSVRNLRE